MKRYFLNCLALLMILSTTYVWSDSHFFGAPPSISVPVSNVAENINMYTGEFTANMNLAGLVGKNGISFALNILYSSNVRSNYNKDNTTNQASIVGLGWNLDIPAIVGNPNCTTSTDHHFDYLGFVANGSYNQLRQISTSDFYKLTDYKFWEIKRTTNANNQILKWEIWDESGMKYTFANRCHRVVRYYYSGTIFIETTDHCKTMGYRWNLTEIEDPFGNKITLHYETPVIEKVSDLEWLGDSFSGYSDYTKAYYLDKIVDQSTNRTIKLYYATGRQDAGDSKNYFSPLTDTNENGDSCQELVFEKNLTDIKVFDKDPDINPDETCLKHTKLNYNYDTWKTDDEYYRKLMLTSVQEYDPRDGQPAFPSTNFTYETNTDSLTHNCAALKTIKLPNGCEKSIVYTVLTMSYTRHFYYTTSITVDDGINTPVVTHYYGTTPKPYNDSLYVGYNSALLSTQAADFRYYFENPGASSAEFYKRGVLTEIETMPAGGGSVKNEVVNTYSYTNKNDGCYYKKLTQTQETTNYSYPSSGSLTSTVIYSDFDDDNGQPTKITTTNTDGTVKILETTFAHDIPQYSNMTEDAVHMVSQIAQQTVYETSDINENAKSSSVTTYKQWDTADPSVDTWAPNKTYQWYERSATNSLQAFNYASWSIHGYEPTSSDDWIQLSEIAKRDDYGNVLSVRYPSSFIAFENGNFSSVQYGYNNCLPVAEIKNAYVNEFAYEGYESDICNWGIHDSNRQSVSNEEAYTGRKSLKVLSSDYYSGWGIDKSFISSGSDDIDQDSKYIFTAWVKAPAIHDNIYLNIYYTLSGGGSGYATPCFYTGNGEWQLLTCILDLGTIANVATVMPFAANYGTNSIACYWDDLRFQPYDAVMKTTVYDPKTFQPIASSNANNYPSFICYDVFGRPIVSLDEDKELLSTSSFYLSRVGSGSDEFESTVPNSTTSISAMGGGEFDDFELTNSLSKYTESQTPSAATWSLDDGYLKSTHVNDGYSFLSNQNNVYTDLVLECDIKYDSDNQLGGFFVRSQDGTYNNCIIVDVNTTKFGFRRPPYGTTEGVVYGGLTHGEWHRVKIIAIDTKYELYVDGELITSMTNSSYSSGYCGMISPHYKDNIYFDNFSVAEKPVVAVAYTDAMGRSIQNQSRDGNYDIITKTEYNSLGKVYKQYKPQKISNSTHAFKTNVTGLCEEFTYSADGLARLTQQKHPDNEVITYAFGKDLFTYDIGQSDYFHYEQVTDEKDKVSRTYFDKFGNKIGGISALGSVNDEIKSANDYDVLGQVTKIKPPNYFDPPLGSSAGDWDTIMTYDTMGRLVQKQSPDEGISRYVYYNDGSLCYSQNAYQDQTHDGFTVYKYDRSGRLLKICEEDDVTWGPPLISSIASYGLETGEIKVENFYDTDYSGSDSHFGIGQLTKVIKYTGTGANDFHQSLYKYDELGHIIKKKMKIFNGIDVSEKIIEHTYDHLGREIQLKYPTGHTIVNSFDNFGRLDKTYSSN